MILNFETLPQYQKLKKALAAVIIVWLLFGIVFSYACTARDGSRERFMEARRVLKAATELKSYPLDNAQYAEPLSSVSAILDKSKLQPKVSQLSSSSTGLLLQINRLYPEEFRILTEELSKSGLVVQTAEVRVLAARRDGKLLNVTMTIRGDKN